MTTPAPGPPPRRRARPRLHFTAASGWVNDAYGIAWADGRYQMYHQALPGRVSWGPDCHWGYAESDDLVHWVEGPLALVPEEYERGCWSGSVVHTAEPPTIFYTRVHDPDWDRGQVATARLDRADGRWHRRAEDVVVPAPPADLGVLRFRDPFVFETDHGWVMLIAAGLAGDVAATLQYRSADLESWTYDGVLCSRPSSETDGAWTGSMWECPQLFPLEDRWVLIVSVWHGNGLHQVAASVGSYDGQRFEPGPWQQVTHGTSAYATAAFADRDGRRCLLSWLREEPAYDGVGTDPATERATDWAGAHSLVSTVRLAEDGALVLRPHPQLAALRTEPLTGRPGPEGERFELGEAPVELTLRPRTGVVDRTVLWAADRAVATFVLDGASGLRLERPGLPDEHLPPGDPTVPVTVVLDADIVEVFGGGYGAYRLRPTAAPVSRVLTSGAPCTVRHLTPLR